MLKRRKVTREAPKKARIRSRADWRPKFLAELSNCGVIGYAAKLAKVSRKTVYAHRDMDESFAAAIAEAIDNSTDVLKAEANRRAVKGVKRVVYHSGRPVGVVTEYSDSLLMFLIKQRDPSFRDTVKINHGNHEGGPLPTPKESAVGDLMARLAGYTAALVARACQSPAGDPASNDPRQQVDSLAADDQAG